jgi:hypothetical protein
LWNSYHLYDIYIVYRRVIFPRFNFLCFHIWRTCCFLQPSCCQTLSCILSSSLCSGANSTVTLCVSTSYVPWSFTLHVHTLDHPVCTEILYEVSYLLMARKLFIYCRMLDHKGLSSSEAIDAAAKTSVCGELTFDQAVVTNVCAPLIYVVFSHIHILILRRVLLWYSVLEFVNNIMLPKSNWYFYAILKIKHLIIFFWSTILPYVTLLLCFKDLIDTYFVWIVTFYHFINNWVVWP